MRLSSLRLTNFRKFREQRVEFPPGGVAILGDNGQGKTNLLEAIYYLEIFRSFRGAPDEQLVRFGESVFRVEGRVEGGRPERVIAAAYDRARKRKKVAVDGVEPARIGDALGQIGVVIFSPSDVEIVSGSPSARRRFLDILLSLTERGYLDDLQRYRQILLRRNAVLRNGGGADVVVVWNEGLVRSGSRIVAARLRWIASRAPVFVRRVVEIAGGGDASLEYEPSIPLSGEGEPPEPARIAELLADELLRVAERETRLGTTLVGPHRDDLRMRTASGDGEKLADLRLYGSGGQQRTAAVALRMVEAETLRDHLQSPPIILLDDVFAELDAARSNRILQWIAVEETAQVILTAPKPGDFELRQGALPVWRLQNGVLSTL